MGREIRRVPVGFDWPLKQTWEGFLLPKELRLPACPDCNGGGDTAASGWIRAGIDMILMAANDLDDQARNRPMHPYLAQSEFKPSDIIYGDVAHMTRFVTRRPGPEMLEFAKALVGEEASRGIFGYGSTDKWYAYRRLLELLGLPEDFGVCPTCKGSGEIGTPEQKAAYEAWEPTDPPEGEAYQLWETVSEGSPVSPPFLDKRELAEWMAAHKCTVNGPFSSVEAALRFIDAGWGPSLVLTAETGVMDGSEFVAQEAK